MIYSTSELRGKVGSIGLTMTVKDAVMPSLLGIDIGCGMSMVKIGTVPVTWLVPKSQVQKQKWLNPR